MYSKLERTAHTVVTASFNVRYWHCRGETGEKQETLKHGTGHRPGLEPVNSCYRCAGSTIHTEVPYSSFVMYPVLHR